MFPSLPRSAATLLLAWAGISSARAADPDTFSKVVSFQYEDALDAPGTTIQSSVVSFQYFETIGDQYLSFATTQPVSFFYKDGVSLAFVGSVTTTGGVSVQGASVSIQRGSTVFWQGTTDTTGTFYAPGLSLQGYTLIVAKLGYITLTQPFTTLSSGVGTAQLFLAPLPAAPQCLDVVRTPPASALGLTPTNSILKTFSGGQFTAGVVPNSGRPTIVLTHGWLSSPADWASGMAQQITQQFSPGTAPNIVAWDWHDAASGGYLDSLGLLKYLSLVTKIDTAAKEGLNLGAALQQALGNNYAQHIHFVGHSLGTIVNRYACDYVHASFPAGSRDALNSSSPWSNAATTPHVTLLDEAELASVVGTSAVTSTLQAAALGDGPAAALLDGALSAAENWKSPLPMAARWVDNYISAIGIQHASAVNVCLPWEASISLSPVDAHSYSYLWYQKSVLNSSGAQAPAVGFGRSYEWAQTFPPSGTGMSLGSLWLQSTATPDSLSLVLDPNPNFGESSSLIAADYAIQVRQKVQAETGVVTSAVVQLGQSVGQSIGNAVDTNLIQPADAVGQQVIKDYQATTQAAGSFVTTTISKTGHVVTETTEKVGNAIDATYNYAVNAIDQIQPDSALSGPVTTPFFRILLSTQAVPQTPSAQSVQTDAAPAAVGQPAYAWMTVHVPANAAFLAFDFTITGQPNADCIVCAINNQNVFNLPAQFAPDNVPSSTDQIDISSLAGQDIELFFGLSGGTSVNCQLAIDGIRFTTIPLPSIGLVDMGTNMGIKWPAAATGWILESSDSLTSGSWQTVSTPNGVAVASGVITLQQPKVSNRLFYRLRRSP